MGLAARPNIGVISDINENRIVRIAFGGRIGQDNNKSSCFVVILPFPVAEGDPANPVFINKPFYILSLSW